MAKDLTQNDIKRAKPKEKPYELRDGRIRGLVLRVQPSGKQAFICEYRIGTRRTRTTLGDARIVTLEQARHEAEDILKDARKGIDYNERKRRAKASTLGGYIKNTYRPYAEAHIKSHADIIGRLNKHFGFLSNRPLGEISETDMARWRKNREGVSFETLKRELTYLKAALNLAVREFKLIDANPLAGYKLQATNADRAEVTRSIRYLAEDEEQRLRAALQARDARIRAERASANKWRSERGYELLPAIRENEYGDHLTPLVLLALNTGLRRGDLFTLEWSHIDFRHRLIRKVINKTSRKRREPVELPLSDEAYTVLSRWQDQSDGDGLLFPSPRTGGRLDNINKAWAALLADAKINDFRFHDLRHSFASRLVMAGVDLNTVRELMTHGDIKMTLVYAHLSKDHKAQALARAFGDEDNTKTA